ncbi:MAG: NAD-dependent deacylase [Chloroflexi bacterium]|nr:NAD-dependent deacylase [Chloroflexota bacterium]
MGEVSSDSVEQAAVLLQQAQRIVVFTGAGISTPSGIPDFRSPNSGLWKSADPLAVASIFGFRQNPQAFFDWIRPLARLITSAAPNPAHEALARLEGRGQVEAVITQNIDMLHTLAGSKRVIELHGHLREATCTQCFTVYQAEPLIARFIEDGQLPRCEKCSGVLKPNVILFGEQLPVRALYAAQASARACDLMVVIGSSLEVAPASDLPVLALRNNAKLIIINLQETPIDRQAALVFRADCAEILPAIVSQWESLSYDPGSKRSTADTGR